MIKRFFYNPYNKKFSLFDGSHVEHWQNHKCELGASFDENIRGIITEENKILLRVYFPYADIESLSYAELLDKSRELLALNLSGIKEALQAQGVTIEGITYNVTNEDAKTLLHCIYV